MLNVFFHSVLVWTFLNPVDVGALECFSCSDVSDPSACNSTVTCRAEESCYQTSILTGQKKNVTLGCVQNKHCGFAASVSSTLVGREVERRQENKCHECCATDQCNDILCARRNPATCIDDETIDCPRLNSVFGICSDIINAKSLCPKFCGLCNVVDGVWTEWTPWSTCDVTCETGTQSRARTCTNPAPANGGQDCVGDKAENKQCHKPLCPVHGHWSSWNVWGACSVSCDFGIQRRLRTCSNPAPERFGYHCFGLNMDDRICIPGACSDGGWTSWDSWSRCSVTCGGGIRSRSRSCTNPRPSVIGRNCDGDSLHVESCNNVICRETTTAFRCNYLSKAWHEPGETFVFTKTALNEGNGYDNSTGVFTAPVAGTYLFSTQLCVDQGHDVVYAIVVDNVNVKVGHFNDKDWTFCHSADTVAVLSKGSRVWVKCKTNKCPLLEKNDYSNTFSGLFVHI